MNIEPQKPFVPIRKLEKEEDIQPKFMIKERSITKRQESTELITQRQSKVEKVKVKVRERSQVITISRISNKRTNIISSEINPAQKGFRVFYKLIYFIEHFIKN